MVNIKQPTLWDTNIFSDDTLIESYKGIFNYVTNIFDVPKKYLKSLEFGRKEEWDIIKSVGYRII